jgi:hypothetical protein
MREYSLLAILDGVSCWWAVVMPSVPRTWWLLLRGPLFVGNVYILADLLLILESFELIDALESCVLTV